MDQANILIIGGGVIGCAIANAASKRWQDVFLVEQFPKLGMATSTRNSGVNHSGIYYPKNSLKAWFCVEGEVFVQLAAGNRFAGMERAYGGNFRRR